MDRLDPGLRGYGQRMRLSLGYFAGTLLEMVEVLAVAIVVGTLALSALPNPAHGDEGRAAFLTAWGLGAMFGAIYVAYRLACRVLFGRALVVPIPTDPNVDWYITMRAFGIAMAGVVFGFAAFYHGLAGDPRLRVGGNAPFVDAAIGCLAVGYLYLGLGKLLGRVTSR
jgi:hypothetical protein